MFNEKYPKASKMAKWALERAKVTTDVFVSEESGKTIEHTCSVFFGRFKWYQGVLDEMCRAGYRTLVDTKHHHVRIEHKCKYVGERGRFMVTESIFKEI